MSMRAFIRASHTAGVRVCTAATASNDMPRFIPTSWIARQVRLFSVCSLFILKLCEIFILFFAFACV